MTTHPDPTFSFAFAARVSIAASERIGHGVNEELWFTPITGGTVDGPLLQGMVVPGGGDWSTKRGDATELDARYLLRAADGALIDIVNRGFWRATAEVEARLEAGEPVDEAEFYYRTQPVFRTDAPAHRWLAETVFVGMAREERGQVCIRFYAVE
jgi:hypothetical protein